MNRAQIIALQERIGTEPDGFWGPQSVAACQRHLRRLMPHDNPWPTQDEASLLRFYGPAGDESRLVNINVRGLGLRFEGASVSRVRVHARCADSLERVLMDIAAGPCAAVLQRYAGTYSNRPMRNGTRPSLHARGAAIDLDPDTNRNKQHWPSSATMPLEVMEAFAREGWLSAGAFWSRDSMHFQSTQ